MAMHLKPLDQQVIVITGASSGIGLATAEMAAQRGAAVVLAARSGNELTEIVSRIRRAGGRATAVAADVSDEAQVAAIADHAIAEFGGFDTWVNNAGVGLYGRLWDIPMADKRRLFEVNFWGLVYGCKAAVRHLRSRGGAIINIGSVTSDVVTPVHGIYSASKHAVRAYTDALRMELEHDGVPIAVTLVKPTTTDTPFPQHAGNYMEKEPTLPPPMYAPEVVADVILRCAERPTRDIVVGGGARMMVAMATIAPRLTDLYMEHKMIAAQQRDEAPWSGDNLYAPAPEGNARRGISPGKVRTSSVYTRAMLADARRALPLLAAGALAAGFVLSRRSGAGATEH